MFLNSEIASTTIINSTGKFDRFKLDQKFFSKGFSKIDQFLKEIETKCDHFPQIQKIYFLHKITMAFSVLSFLTALVLLLVYDIIGTLSIQDNRASQIGYVLIILSGVVFFLNFMYKSIVIKKFKGPYSQFIDSVIENYRPTFDLYPITVKYTMSINRYFIFVLEIYFELRSGGSSL